jgi:DNA-binding GntR family transcriptional regulator
MPPGFLGGTNDLIYFVLAVVSTTMINGALLYKSLKDVVLEYILREIDEGRLRPGDRIDKNEISAKLQVSGTPVREALLQLEPCGLVSFFPRRGIVVNDLSPTDTRELFQAIAPLEATAARMATPLLDAKAFDAMERSIEKMIQLTNTELPRLDQKPRALNRENQAFHEVYLSRCGNRILAETVRTLKRRFYVVPHPMAYLEAYEQQVIDEHRELVELFRKRDAHGAARLLEDRHWNWTHNRQYALETYFPPGTQIAG